MALISRKQYYLSGVCYISHVQGLYPESHGIVDNHFYDKTLKDSFSLGDTDPKWWQGEPVS